MTNAKEEMLKLLKGKEMKTLKQMNKKLNKTRK